MVGGDWRLLHEWKQWLAAQGMSEHTIRLYSYGVFRLHVETDIDAADLEEHHITAFLAGIKDHAKAREQYFRGIRSWCKWAARRGHIKGGDPTMETKVKGAKPRPKAVLEEDELIRILIAAWWRHPRRAWTLLLSFSLGTRRMEVAGIEPSDVGDDAVMLRHTKGGKWRLVELGPLAEFALEQLRPYYNGTVLGGVKPQTVTAWAKRAARDAGLSEKVRGRPSHILRASFITYMLRRGEPVEVVRDLVGHDNIATTNAYAVSTRSERRDAMQRHGEGLGRGSSMEGGNDGAR